MKLELYPPLEVWKVTQKYGNKNPIYNDMGGYHNGIDLRAPHGTPVYASHDGFATYQVDNGGGHGVVVITDKEYEYENGTSFFKTIYWHFVDWLKEPRYKSPIADKTGFTPVKKGDLLGYADNTGRSTGSHLHYALKPVAKGEGWGTWYTPNSMPPYYGAIDPMPYMKLETVDYGNYNFTKNIQVGSRGQDVLELQKLLITLGYMSETDLVDGIYGNQTKRGVLAFQVNERVITSPLESAFGYYCGPKTRRKLNEFTSR